MIIGFYIDAKTAYRAIHELGLGINKFSIPPLTDHSLIYGINLIKNRVYTMTRTNIPRLKLDLNQVSMLMITPVEARQELLKSWL